MRRAILFVSALVFSFLLNAQLPSAVGSWKDYFSYNSLKTLSETNDGLVAASDIGLFYYRTSDNSVQSFTKVDGLSSTNISMLQFFPQTNSTYIGYLDGNIDIIQSDGSLDNIGDLFRSTIIGDKTINGFQKINNQVWALTSVGILVLDPNTNFVIDTYRFGDNGSSIDVQDIALIGDTIFAATSSGLFKANKNNSFLSNFQNWTKVLVSGVSGQQFNEIETFGNKLYLNYNSGAWPNDVMLESADQGLTFSISTLISGFQCKALRAYDNELLVSDLFATSIFDENLNRVNFSADFNGDVLFIEDAVFMNGTIFQATQQNALVANTNGQTQMIAPKGPQSNEVWQVNYSNNTLAVAAGGVNQTHSSLFNNNGFSILKKDGTWYNQPFKGTTFNGFADALSVAVDPLNANHVFVGTYGNGLMEFLNEELVTTFTNLNSPIEDRPQIPDATYPSYIEFDNSGNLWVINSFASRPVKILKTDGTWLEFEVDPSTGNRNLFTFSSYEITSNNQVWITKHREGITVLDLGDLSTIADDQTRYLTSAFGNGGLPSGDVKCLVEDNNGALWGGSDKGLFIYFNPLNIFTNTELNAQQIFIEQDGNVQIVLETEQVNDIYVDGGNRKWVATQNSGLFLFSEDGEEQLAKYTPENSPILSNAVLNLSMNNETGELFVGTDKGLQSIQTDAKSPEFGEKLTLRIFPNPVQKEYTEPVVIEGFASETRFTVTDANGRLIFRGSTNGGRATWDYKNQRGESVGTGVYFVFAQDDFGTQTRKGKFLLFR